jgi:H+/Cl- antiporter ClcA
MRLFAQQPALRRSIRAWTITLIFSAVVVYGCHLLGKSGDCTPHEIDGQCGMSTAIATAGGIVCAVAVVFGVGIYRGFFMRKDD